MSGNNHPAENLTRAIRVSKNQNSLLGTETKHKFEEKTARMHRTYNHEIFVLKKNT